MAHLIKLSQASCVVLISIIVISVSAKPANRKSDEPPKLSDTLAVAKSPFEPITLAPSLPGARNGALPISSEPALDKFDHDQLQIHRQSTRAVQATSEQERETTASNGMSETSGLDGGTETSSESSPSIESLGETTTTTGATMTTTAATTTTTITAAPIDFTTTVKEELDKSSPTTTEAPQPTTTLAPTTTTTTTTSAPASEPIPASESPATSSNTDLANERIQTTTTLAPTTTTISILKVVEETVTPDSDKSSSVANEPASSTDSTTTTTEAATTITASPTTAAVDQSTNIDSENSSVNRETEATTTALAPKPSSTEATAVSSTTSTTSVPETTSTPSSVDKKDNDGREDKQSCNHLPTYEADEIQKVFREETTYKNGTIKGKFTYINFDQRYRLVHYTRLPYGPVKIDLVEELGRPEQNGNQSSSTSNSNEVPNAVLQLRNILPNSLFGFPFIGPQQGQAGNNKPVSEHKVENENDKSNTYFYSTDTISTPNLLTPSVPVSLLPGQRKFSNRPNGPLQSYFEDSPVDSNSQKSTGTLESNKLTGASPILTQDVQKMARENTLFGAPLNQHQFQYATLASQAAEPSSKPGLFYSYQTRQQHPSSQYQYSPLPLYSFQQPNYYPQTRNSFPPSQYISAFNKQTKSENVDHSEPSLIEHQMHQPHSHQHYVAPFLFTQPPGLNNDQPEASKLRLRVKSAKSIQNGRQETLGKSAQLRAFHEGIYSAPINSPVENHRLHQRQRSGKQNQELKHTINTTPVVYHVLRSPVGRMYTLPQYNHEYAMAYDHND